jgi:hypothetical protein
MLEYIIIFMQIKMIFPHRNGIGKELKILEYIHIQLIKFSV